ncbi:type VI secretion system protein TssA [Myxococcus sp. Y35]|uniref:type VI secretion system protein TssA n=1 Tax=Pseudomyxococcus flavus TaxID=3115648 RepID=UPI003CF452A9
MPPTLEQLRERARPWAEPVPGASPAGVQAKHEPAYEAVAMEVAKLESPASDAVRWDDVVAGASDLLKHTTKDLWLASYLAYGLYATRGVDGAATGAAVLAEVTERYWPDLFPEMKRLRGRANAVAWFVERLGRILPTVEQSTVSAAPLDALTVAVKRLSQVSRERFSDMAPAFGPLQDAIARLRAGLPAPEPEDVASRDSVEGSREAAAGDGATAGAGAAADASDDAEASRDASADARDAATSARGPGGAPGMGSRSVQGIADVGHGKDNTSPAQGASKDNPVPARAQAAGNGNAAQGSAAAASGNPAQGKAAGKGSPGQGGAAGKGNSPGPNKVAPGATPHAATQLQVPPLPELPSVPDLSGAEAVTDFLRTVGGALLGAAGALRRAQAEDPLSYRLTRMGLWLHLSQPPVPNAEGRTEIPPVPKPLATQLETLAQNQRWSELLDESESALSRHRFTLTLHRYSAMALEGMGDAYTRARASLVQELGIQLRRMPGVETLRSKEGTPLTDDATRDWLRDEVLRTGTATPTDRPAPATALALGPLVLGPSDNGEAAALDGEARTLLAEGRIHEAVTRLQSAVSSAGTGRARFIARLELARLCANAGQLPLARAVYDALDEEVSTHALDTWEPALAAACLEGWLQTRTSAEKEAGPVAVKFRNRYRRLALLDSSATLRVGA